MIDTTLLPMPRTPREALGETEREHVTLEDRDFVIERPSDSDALMDHPAVRAVLAANDYMPYWTDIWPAARQTLSSPTRTILLVLSRNRSAVIICMGIV